MFRRAQYIPVIVGGLLASCALAGGVGSVGDEGVSAEIFRAAIAELRQEIDGVLLVDPRPIRLNAYWAPQVNSYYGDVDDMVRERTGVLAAMGVDTVTGVPLIPDCHGLLSNPPGLRVVHGCPDVRTVVVLADTIRRGPRRGQWLLPVLPTIYEARFGRHATLSDLVIVRRGGVFRVIDWRSSATFEHD